MIAQIANWYRNATEKKYNRAWDEFLNNAIDKGEVEYVSPHAAMFSGVQVWIANYPYASARPYDMPEIYPSKATIHRVNEAVLSAVIARGGRK